MRPPGAIVVSTRRGELTAALALAAIAAGALFMATGMPAGTVAEPGPGVFPTGISACLLAVSLGLVVRALRMPSAALQESPEGAEPQGPASDVGAVQIGHKLIWISLFSLVLFGLLLEPLGFPVSAALFMAALLRSFSTLGWVRSMLGGIAAAAIAWFFFVQLLGVNLPAGILQLN